MTAAKSSVVERLSHRIENAKLGAGLLVGAALGGAPTFWADDSGRSTRWFFGSLVVIGLAFSIVALRANQRRNRLLTSRGTVYVIESPGQGWSSDEMDAFLKPAPQQFANVMHVPGPTGLSEWRWPLDDRALRWSDALDDLVVSTRSVARNDDPTTPNSIVCRAWFPVAIGLTARLRAVDRAFELKIRQRPSRGRGGRIDVPDWDQGTHTFERTQPAGLLGDPAPARQATLVLANPPVGTAETVDIRVLLVRTNDSEWGTVPADDSAEPVTIEVANRSGTPWAPGSVEFRELRILPQGEVHPWTNYPVLAAGIADWIADQAHPTGVTLLGMTAPQEVHLGIGIDVARREQARWPKHLWPLIKVPGPGNSFVIPALDLGWESMHLRHHEGPR